MRRVVITGAGSINALGRSVEETFVGLREGRCGISDLAFRDVERLSIRIGGQIHGYDETAHFSRSEIALYDRITQFALLCSDEAIKDSGLDLDACDRTRVGAIVGSGIGGLDTTEKQVLVLHNRGVRRVSPFLVPMMMINAAASTIYSRALAPR